MPHLFGGRPRRSRAHNGKMHPAAIVGIVLAATLLVTLTVGNLLRLWLDDETYRKLTEGDTEPPEIEQPTPTSVRNINAYPYILGESPDTVLSAPAISVLLCDRDGKPTYRSDVTDYLARTPDTDTSLRECMGEMSAFVPYISGVFYTQAFRQGSSELRYAAAAQEAALIREFLCLGGSEIVLGGIPWESAAISDITAYVGQIDQAAQNLPVGVAIPYAVASDPAYRELLATLLYTCDFCVLDLREIATDPTQDAQDAANAAAAILSDCHYYLHTCDMRLMLCAAQSELIAAAETRMLPDYMIVSE